LGKQTFGGDVRRRARQPPRGEPAIAARPGAAPEQLQDHEKPADASGAAADQPDDPRRALAPEETVCVVASNAAKLGR
jgi:hypothetical protein